MLYFVMQNRDRNGGFPGWPLLCYATELGEDDRDNIQAGLLDFPAPHADRLCLSMEPDYQVNPQAVVLMERTGGGSC
jgi:hypothetical protein